MEYLHVFQDFREGAPQFINLIFVIISEAIIYVAPVVPALIFLCVDKDMGAFGIFSVSAANAISNTIKVTACVYRPWIKDPTLHPYSAIESSATGYSFPSGHTTFGTGLYGSIIVMLNKNKKRIAQVIFGILLLLTGFARMYLGAHTIYDVGTAIILSLFVVFLMNILVKYLKEHPEKDVWVLVITTVLTVAALIYMWFKKYPLDTDAAGAYLADPVIMAKDGFGAFGLLFGAVLSWFVERRWINFDIKGKKSMVILRGVVGTIIFALFYLVISKKIALLFEVRVGAFIRYFITAIVSLMIYPLIIKLIQTKTKKEG